MKLHVIERASISLFFLFCIKGKNKKHVPCHSNIKPQKKVTIVQASEYDFYGYLFLCSHSK
jgi:hypothetical protein